MEGLSDVLAVIAGLLVLLAFFHPLLAIGLGIGFLAIALVLFASS